MRYNTAMLAPLLHAALAFAGQAPDYELPPFQLPADIVEQVRARIGGEPLPLLAGIASMDLDVRSAAVSKWNKLDVRSQCALVRAGLRSTDAEVAIGAAVKAGGGIWLDIAETKRAAAVGLPRCNVAHTPFRTARFFDLLDGEDTARLLASPGPRPRSYVQFLGPLHHRFGPEHWAQVELLAHGDDWLLRQDATRYLNFLKSQRLRYAHFLLSRPVVEPDVPADFDPIVDRSPYQPRKFRLRAKGPGFHPVLAALLEHLFLSGRKNEPQEATFAWRWALAQTPADIDRALLLQLIESEHEEGRRVAVRGLAVLGGEQANNALRRISNGGHEDLSVYLALAELVEQNDRTALDRLVQLAPDHTLALAALWRVDRRHASRFVDRALQVPGHAALAHLLEACADGDFWGLPMTGLSSALSSRANAASVDGATLGLLLGEMPQLRTAPLLRRAIDALTAHNVEAMPLAVLELGGEAALAKRLHAILTAKGLSHDVLVTVMHALTRLSPESLGDDDTVVGLFGRCGDVRSDEDCARMRVRIAASRGGAVRHLAIAGLQGEPVSASWRSAGSLAIATAACGIDASTAMDLLNYLVRTRGELFAKVHKAMLTPLRAGNGAQAIAKALSVGGVGLERMEVWRLPDDIALPLLRRGLEQRERGEYREAIAQLMRRGDPQARAVIEGVIRDRLYGWIDWVGTDTLTDGLSLDRVPLLLSQVDSNCCTYAVIATALEHVFEVDAFVGEFGARSRADLLRATWQQHREHLQWSRIANRWLIMPTQ